jgi:HEAT repeat protein
MTLAVLAIVLILLPADIAQAHGGRFKPPVVGATPGEPGEPSAPGAQQKGFSFPGGGPQVAFRESMWEYWWDFHHEPILGLRNTLFARTPSAGVIDFPFEKITADEKRVSLVRKLVEMLKESEQEQAVRAAAVIALARTKDANIVPYIEMTYMNDGSLDVRTMAVVALGITQNPRAVSVLDAIIQDDDESDEIRFYALVALGMVGGQEAAMAFRKYLDPKSFRRLERDIQRGAAFGSGLTNDPTLAPMVRALLINNLAEDDVTQSFLVLSLGRLGDRAANPILIKQLDEGHVHVRRSSAIALGAAATPADTDVVSALGKAANSDADLMVKNFATLALGRIGGPDAEKIVLKLFNSVIQTKLPFAALSLGLIGNGDNGAVLLKRFKSTRDNSTRSALALAMGMLRYTPCLGELRKVMDSETSPILRSYCAQALGMMRDSESIERLRKVCSEANDVELIRSTAIALGLIGDPGALEVLKGMLSPRRSDIVRSSAAYCMGLIGDRKAITSLLEVAGDDGITSQIRSYAVIGLGLLGDESPYPAVSAITRNNNYTIMETYLYELFNIN